jgi:hypothetical protein
VVFLIDVNDYANSTLACLGTAEVNKYLAPGTTEPIASQYVYNNAGLTSTYDGNNSWHLMSYGGNTWGVNIDTDGLITVAIAC